MQITDKKVGEIVAEIKTIDEQLVKAAGTVSERRQKAEQVLRAQESTVPEGAESPVGGPFTALDELAAQIAELTDKLADLKNETREAVDGYLRSQKDETSTAHEALKTQREALVKRGAAMAELLEIPFDVPKAPRGSGASSNGSGPRSTAKGVWSYRREDSDEWTVPNEHQQSLSSIAYRVFDKVPTGTLKQALSDAGVTSLTTSFEQKVTVNGKSATIRFEVVKADESK